MEPPGGHAGEHGASRKGVCHTLLKFLDPGSSFLQRRISLRLKLTPACHGYFEELSKGMPIRL